MRTVHLADLGSSEGCEKHYGVVHILRNQLRGGGGGFPNDYASGTIAMCKTDYGGGVKMFQKLIT